jgi:hypothetical protein
MTFVEPSVEMERASIHLNNAAQYLKRIAAAASRGSVAGEHENAKALAEHLRLALEHSEVAKLFPHCDCCGSPLILVVRQPHTTLLCNACASDEHSPHYIPGAKHR